MDGLELRLGDTDGEELGRVLRLGEALDDELRCELRIREANSLELRLGEALGLEFLFVDEL